MARPTLRPILSLAASSVLAVAGSTLATAASASAAPAAPADLAPASAVHPHVKRSAHDSSAALRQARTRSGVRPQVCGDPALVSSTGGVVKVGVSYEQTLSYGVTIDDDCLTHDGGNVVIYLYQANGAYYSVDATFQQLDRAGNQNWQARFAFDPSLADTNAYPLDSNDYAGTWHAGVRVPGTTKIYDFPGADALVQRASVLTVNASEPTKQGATETVVGTLKRADWQDDHYHGYAGQPVQLQFRTTTGSYATLKTVNTDSYGNLRTTTTATVDGCYRWVFAGNATTPAAVEAGDCVDVT